MAIFHLIELTNNYIDAIKAEFFNALMVFFVLVVVFFIVFSLLNKKVTEKNTIWLPIILAIIFLASAAIYDVNFKHPSDENLDSQQKITFN
jgi:apolipoprotein N-acyltransferase